MRHIIEGIYAWACTVKGACFTLATACLGGVWWDRMNPLTSNVTVAIGVVAALVFAWLWARDAGYSGWRRTLTTLVAAVVLSAISWFALWTPLARSGNAAQQIIYRADSILLPAVGSGDPPKYIVTIGGVEVVNRSGADVAMTFSLQLPLPSRGRSPNGQRMLNVRGIFSTGPGTFVTEKGIPDGNYTITNLAKRRAIQGTVVFLLPPPQKFGIEAWTDEVRAEDCVVIITDQATGDHDGRHPLGPPRGTKGFGYYMTINDHPTDANHSPVAIGLYSWENFSKIGSPYADQ